MLLAGAVLMTFIKHKHAHTDIKMQCYVLMKIFCFS